MHELDKTGLEAARALIERLEHMKQPSRMVDAQIACAFPTICIWQLPENASGFTAHADGGVSFRSPGKSHSTIASAFTEIPEAAIALIEALGLTPDKNERGAIALLISALKTLEARA